MDIKDHLREIREIIKDNLYCRCVSSAVRSDGKVPYCEDCGKEVKVASRPDVRSS